MIVAVDLSSVTPLYQQLYDQFVIGIASGLLQSGEELPSVRRLAADIGINMHTVNKVYLLLRDAGYVVLNRRSGAVVNHLFSGDAKSFLQQFEQKLRPLAAEAKCHGWTEDQFANQCVITYRSVFSDHPSIKTQEA